MTDPPAAPALLLLAIDTGLAGVLLVVELVVTGVVAAVVVVTGAVDAVVADVVVMNIVPHSEATPSWSPEMAMGADLPVRALPN
jgi:hypothetical protein